MLCISFSTLGKQVVIIFLRSFHSVNEENGGNIYVKILNLIQNAFFEFYFEHPFN